MTMNGDGSTRLILLRGNSGSGKSALAAAIRSNRPRGIAIIGQDTLRRNILHVPDNTPSLTADYIELSAQFALKNGLNVIIEGILYTEIYGSMLRGLISAHQGITRCYRYKLPFEETLRRHKTKPEAGNFGEIEMRQWWREEDTLTGVDETIIGPGKTLEETAKAVIVDCGWEPCLTTG